MELIALVGLIYLKSKGIDIGWFFPMLCYFGYIIKLFKPNNIVMEIGE